MSDDRPLLVIVGNCQAESLRLLLDAGDVRTQRLPALHEMTSADVVALHALLSRADLLVAQPTSNDYRGLPLGTAQLRAVLPPSARVALVPSLRYAGLHPFHLLVHPPDLERPDPPVVPYHDVRTVIAAADLRAGRTARAPLGLTSAAVRAVAAASVREMSRRERTHGTIVVSDLLTRPTPDTMRTINHPGNALLEPVAARLRATLGLEAREPAIDRPLLTSIHAPLHPEVVAAHGLDVAPTADWTVERHQISPRMVEMAHLAWYRARPEMLDAALTRVEPLRELLSTGRAADRPTS